MKPTQNNHMPPLGHKSTYLPTETRFKLCTSFNLPYLKCEKACRCIPQARARVVPAVVPPASADTCHATRHLLQDGGGHAAEVRELHRAGAQEQEQQRRVRGEDLDAEERN